MSETGTTSEVERIQFLLLAEGINPSAGDGSPALLIGWFAAFNAPNSPGVFRRAFSRLEDRENTTMTVVWEELTLGLLDAKQLLRVFTRLLAATLLGAAIGFQRERAGKPAGLRTHTLVSLCTTLLILSCSAVGMSLTGYRE